MVAVPLSRRVVEVIADRGSGVEQRYSYGSGCIVHGRTVLTSAHVVAGAENVHVRRMIDKQQLHAASLSEEFVGDAGGWREDGSAGPDLALVSITDESVDLPRMSLGRVDRDHTAGPVDRVRVVGYPWFSDRVLSKPVRVPVEACGQIPPLTNHVEGLLGVNVTISPPPRVDAGKNGTQWSGMSGAPVLVGGRLVGVVAEHTPRAGDATITAVPLTALEADAAYPLWGPGVANCGDWWRRLGVGGLDDLEWVPPPVEAPYRATLRQFGVALHGRMPRLIGRDQELREIAAFASGREGYRWLVGGAFAGKSALLYEAVTAGLPEDVDVVCYFLSRRASDADSSRFLEAIVPQLEVLCGAESGAGDRDRFHQLWQRAERQAAAAGRHLLMVIDGLDEDLHPLGEPPVSSLLPIVSGSHSHLLVSSRPHPRQHEQLPAGHPLAACEPEELAAFEGAADLAGLATAEIDALISGPQVDDLGMDALGLLTAAAGPLSTWDLATLYSDPAPPRAADARHLREVVTERAARSLEPIGPQEQPRFQFAHASLSDHALRSEDLADPEYRARIHRWAARYREERWPTPESDRTGTPRYLLDTYATTLAGNPDHHELFPAEPDRLASLAGDIEWVATALPVIGVDRVLAALRAASALAPSDAKVADLLSVVAAQAHNLRPPRRIGRRSYVLRQMSLQAMEFGRDDLANEVREDLLALDDPGPIPTWVTVTGRPPALELGSHDGSVAAVGVLPDGRIVSAGRDQRVLLWDPTQPGQSVELGHHDRRLNAVGVLPDGRVVSAGDDGRMRLWDPTLPGQSVELGSYDRWVNTVGVLPDGRIVSGGDDGRVRLWDPEEPADSVELGRHDSAVRAVAVLPDGRIVSGGDDRQVRLWDPEEPADSVELGRHDSAVRAVAVLPDGRIVSGGDDGRVRLWDPEEPGDSVELGRHDSTVRAVAVLPDGRIVSGGDDGRVRLWDPEEPADSVELGRHDSRVRAVAVLPDGRIVSGGDDGRVRLWDPEEPGDSVELGRHDSRVRAVAVLPDGRIVSGGDDGRVRLWDPEEPGHSVELGRHDSRVRAVAVLPDGRIVSGGDDGRVRLWDPEEPGHSVELGRHDRWVNTVAVLPDGRIVSGGDDRQVRLWDPEEPGDSVALGRHLRWVKSVAVLPDGRIVSGGDDGRVRLLDPTEPGKPVELGSHGRAVTAVAGLDDGRAVSSELNGRMCVWDPTRPGQPLELGSHDGSVTVMAALASGRVVSGGDGRVRVWDPTQPGVTVAEIACPFSALGATSPSAAIDPRLAIAHVQLGLSTWSLVSHEPTDHGNH